MYAIDDLSDAIDVTRNFLTPVRGWVWAKLAIVVFFIGGVGFSFPSIPSGDVGQIEEDLADLEEVPVGDVEAALTDETLLIIALIVGAFLVIGLIWAIIARIFEFVFIESLRNDSVHVRRYFKRNLGNGVRLLVFEIFLGVFAALLILGPLGAIWAIGGDLSGISLGVWILYGFFALAFGLVYILINSLTIQFIVPVMLHEERGVFGAWKRFWGPLWGNWTEYLVYVILAWLVGVVAAIAIGILTVIIAIPLTLIFIFLTIALFLALETVGLGIAAVLGLIGYLIFAFVVALIELPVVSYLRYYALLVLGDTDTDLDLIPDQRAAVRTDGGELDDGVTGGEPDGDHSSESGDSPSVGWEDTEDRRGTHWDDEQTDDTEASWDDEGTSWDDEDRPR